MSARMSAREASWICSGAMYASVPIVAPVFVSSREHGLLIAERSRQAKVHYLDDVLRPVLAAHEIMRLDVPMHHALLAGMLQAERGLVDVVACEGHRQRSLLLDSLGQVLALHVLHGKQQQLARLRRRISR